jgi:hypothetical protein
MFKSCVRIRIFSHSMAYTNKPKTNNLSISDCKKTRITDIATSRATFSSHACRTPETHAHEFTLVLVVEFLAIELLLTKRDASLCYPYDSFTTLF